MGGGTRRRGNITLAAGMLILAAVWLPGQRSGDVRDPDLRYDEGWVSLFNGKDFGKLVAVLKTEDGKSRKYFEATMCEQKTFYVEDGLLKTTGTPNGYIRTSDVYDNYVFHVGVRFPQRGNSGALVHIQRDDVWSRSIECQLYQSHMGRIFPIKGAYLEGGEMIHENSVWISISSNVLSRCRRSLNYRDSAAASHPAKACEGKSQRQPAYPCHKDQPDPF